MRVAITGATGTFGNAFVRHLLTQPDVERLVCISRDELKQAHMADELGDQSSLRFFLGDVRDLSRMTEAFYSCDTVVHAAALKRVDSVVFHPDELIKTNVIGTMNVVRAAIDAGVRRVLIISSDKAVHATNIYGASKFLAEGYATGANAYGHPRGTRIACVRYGNVLGSRGSVLHLWRRQVAEQQPITLTDARMTRFWLTIAEAVGLVDTALAHMQGGEVFIPNLPAVTMTDVAEALAPGHPLKVTGLRPGGEKLHEQLLSDEEVGRTLAVDRHYIVTPSHRSWASEPWEGAPIDPTMLYRSDVRWWRLSVEGIRGMIGGGQ